MREHLVFIPSPFSGRLTRLMPICLFTLCSQWKYGCLLHRLALASFRINTVWRSNSFISVFWSFRKFKMHAECSFINFGNRRWKLTTPDSTVYYVKQKARGGPRYPLSRNHNILDMLYHQVRLPFHQLVYPVLQTPTE